MAAPQARDEHEVTTDDVLSESVERVRSSRQLIDRIDERLQRGESLLSDDARTGS